MESQKKFDGLINDNGNQIANPHINTQIDANQIKVNAETYTAAESIDVNSIIVTIPDEKTPIVVLFGAPSSGKTLVLLRMIRFLEQNGYQVVPEEVFRPKTDRHYERMCSRLKDLAYSNYAPGGTDIISFMLVKVLDPVGNPVCQILEAPGEHYFDGSSSNAFPTYINRIINSKNRKIWMYFVEQNWGKDANERALYAQKISNVGSNPSKDSTIFLFNKVDKYRNQFLPDGTPNMNVFFAMAKQQYPGIFEKYRNRGLMKVLYGAYNFRTLCFSTGTFNKTGDGREVWTLGEDRYCKDLWRAITK